MDCRVLATANTRQITFDDLLADRRRLATGGWLVAPFAGKLDQAVALDAVRAHHLERIDLVVVVEGVQLALVVDRRRQRVGARQQRQRRGAVDDRARALHGVDRQAVDARVGAAELRLAGIDREAKHGAADTPRGLVAQPYHERPTGREAL